MSISVTQQLAEALEGLAIGFTVLGKAVEKNYGPPPADFHQRIDKAKAALARHRAAQARPDRESTCPDCGTDCPCYQEGLEAQREHVGGGTV